MQHRSLQMFQSSLLPVKHQTSTWRCDMLHAACQWPGASSHLATAHDASHLVHPACHVLKFVWLCCHHLLVRSLDPSVVATVTSLSLSLYRTHATACHDAIRWR